ncbi:MAG: lipoyl synthase [bacterium]
MATERFPARTKKKIAVEKVYEIKAILSDLNINTVCEAAKCPNIGECFSKPTLTFMILGNVCSRDCTFCAIEKGKPRKVDFDEPRKVAQAARMMGLKHTIITSVARDDLADGGALLFAHTVFEVSKQHPNSTIEVLVPDFNGCRKSIHTVLDANPNIFNHNIETVPRLYTKVRYKANYEKSLKVLKMAKRINSNIITKSGLMVGLGETEEEVLAVMKDLMLNKCDILTIGQYLQPTRDNIPVHSFITPERFVALKEQGLRMGFRHVESAPFVRSSYNAEPFLIGALKNQKTGTTEHGTIPAYKETAAVRI